MNQKLRSLRIRMLLPVVAMTLCAVALLTTLFSRAYISMVLQQENEVNAVAFDTISRSVTPMIQSSIGDVRTALKDDRVASYARLQYTSLAEQVRARLACRDFLASEIERNDGIYGLLFMRNDESMFGALPQGALFLDVPEDNPLPETVKTQILNAPFGQTVWVGPLSATIFYGFENQMMPQNIMIAAWKNVDVSYGDCYAMMLMDEAIFDRLFASLQDEKAPGACLPRTGPSFTARAGARLRIRIC